jgi:hypothetical protein
MPCEEAERLRRDLKDAQERFTQFGYKQNQPNSGATKTKAAQIAKGEQSRMTELSNELLTHVGSCLTCRVDRAVIVPRGT